MRIDQYSALIRRAVVENDDHTIDLIAQCLIESEEAKHELRSMGIGWTGCSLKETVDLVVEKIKSAGLDNTI